MADRHNPYIAGAPVVEKRMFFGREGVFDWIENSLSGKYVDHILVLHGQRRVGKTSVLKHIPNRLPGRYIPVFIDLQGRVSTSLGRFLGWLAREITRALKDQGIELPRPDRKAFEDDPEYFENVFLPAIQFHLGDRALLLTFDEFDTFESTDAQEGLAIPFMAILKRLMDHPYLSFVFSIGSSGRKLENMQAAYTSFFKQALYRKISFLEPDDARELVAKPVEGVVSYSDKAIDSILDVTSRHPYFVQLICHELFSECQKNDKWQVDLNDVNAILDPVVERGTVNLKFVWDEADDLEKWILAVLATVEDGLDLNALENRLKAEQVRYTRQELERALLRLREKDVVTPDNRFVIHLLKLWLQRNRPMEQVREELEEVNPIVNRLLEIGQEYHNKGEFEDAVRSFDEALKVEETNLDARQWLGSSQLARGDYGKAISEFESVLEVKIDDVVAQKGYCDSYLAMGDESRADGKLEEAEYAYQQVLGINSEHQKAHRRMAEIHHRRAVGAIVGGPEAALEELKKALEYAEEDAFRSAHDELTAFLAGERKLVDVLLSWGQTVQEIGLWDEAGELLDAYRLESGDEQTVAETITEIREHVLERRKDELRQRAARLENLGRYNQAAAAWTSYLKLAPDEIGELQSKITELQKLDTQATEDPRKRSPLFRVMVTTVIVVLFGAITWLLAQPSSPLRVALAGPTSTPTYTLAPTATLTQPSDLEPTSIPTDIPPTPAPTAIPMSWSRVSSVSFLDRDEVGHIVFDPNDPDVMYAGTEFSGIYKTINGGITWEPAQTGMEGNRINSLVIHPTDSDILYAGVLDDGPYKTTDGGQTWERLRFDGNRRGTWQFTSEITMDPNNPDELYFTDGTTIYHSSDAGDRWYEFHRGDGEPFAELSVGPDGKVYYTAPWRSFNVGEIDPETGLVIKYPQFKCNQFNCGYGSNYDEVVAFSEETGRMFVSFQDYMYYSEDGGETWTSTGKGCVRAEFDDNGNGLCIEHHLQYTADGGLTWSPINYPNIQTIDGAISPHDPDTIVIGGRFGIYKSTNRGASWENISNGIGNGHTGIQIALGNNLMYLRPQPGEGDYGDIYAAEIGSRTFDLIWKVPNRDGHSSYLSPDGKWYHFQYSSSGKIMLSSDNGPFQALPLEVDPNVMHPLGMSGGFVQDGVEYLYAGLGDKNIMYITSDYWETWETIEYKTDDEVWWIYPDLNQTGRLYSLNNALSYSNDGGERWYRCGSSNSDSFWHDFGMWPPGGANLISLDPREGGRFFFVTTSEGLVYNVTADCSRLKKVFTSSGLTNYFTTAVIRHPENPDIVYVGTANGFFVSFNNGETWGEVNDGLLGAQTIYSLAVDLNDPDTVYAATPYGVFRLEGK